MIIPTNSLENPIRQIKEGQVIVISNKSGSLIRTIKVKCLHKSDDTIFIRGYTLRSNGEFHDLWTSFNLELVYAIA